MSDKGYETITFKTGDGKPLKFAYEKFAGDISKLAIKSECSAEEIYNKLLSMMTYLNKLGYYDEDIDIEESTGLTDFIEEFRKGRRGEDHNEIY